MSMHDIQDEKSIFASYQLYADYVQKIQKILHQIGEDLELALNGWKLHYSIDFAELFRFSYPLSQRIHVEPLPGEKDQDAYVREMVSLAFCFAKANSGLLTNTNNMVLLPPYVEEMGHTLGIVRDRLTNLRAMLAIYNSLDKSLFDGFLFKNTKIQTIIKNYRDKGQVPNAEESKEIAEYISNYYQDLVSYIISPTHQGAKTILRLIRNQTILPLGTYLNSYFTPEILQSINLQKLLLKSSIEELSQKYLKIISDDPYRKERFEPNKTDAIACAYLEIINNCLSGKRDLMFILSHSKAINRAVMPIKIESSDGTTKEIPGGRDLNYLWVYFVHRQEEVDSDNFPELNTFREKMLSRVRGVESLFTNFLSIWTELRNDKYTPNATYEKAAEILKKVQRRIKQYSNICFSIKTDDDVLNLINDASDNVTPDHTLKVALGKQLVEIVQNNNVMTELILKRDVIRDMIINLDHQLKEVSLFSKPTE
jgi:hypothetical protein